MSFDLAVFRSRRPLDDKQALRVYEALCSKNGATEAAAALEPTPRLEAFYRALTRSYPELGDDEEASPFATDIERRPYAVVMNVSLSRANDVAAAVERLAKDHDLDVFDPQEERLVRASDADAARRPVPPQKLKAKEGVLLLASGLEPRLAKLGFVPSPKVKYAWSRTQPNGVVHEVSLNLGTRDVRPDVAVGHPKALAWLSAATGARGETLPRMGLEYLFLRGWIPTAPWREVPTLAFNHEICHSDCVAKSVKRFVGEVKKYALPFFNALTAVDDIADFFDRKKAFSQARPNWTLDREASAGATERFWRADRALLFEVAMGALADPKSLDRRLAAAARREKAWSKKKVFGWTPNLAAQLDALRGAIGRG